MASFFAGAVTAALAGFYLLYKDYMLSHEAVSRQVKGIYDNVDERYDALTRRCDLENLKEVEPAKPKEAFD